MQDCIARQIDVVRGLTMTGLQVSRTDRPTHSSDYTVTTRQKHSDDDGDDGSTVSLWSFFSYLCHGSDSSCVQYANSNTSTYL